MDSDTPLNEDRLPEPLARAAGDYHEPPDTPREEMWRAIAVRISKPSAVRTVWPGRSTAPRLAVAAVILLMAGIGIGRLTAPSGTPGDETSVAAVEGAESVAERVRIATTTEHLRETEAFLTSFESRARTGGVDGRVSAGAYELLASTRHLLDSTQDDARLRSLLEDLELVLAQIARLPAERPAVEVRLISGALEEQAVLTRLRAATPIRPIRNGA